MTKFAGSAYTPAAKPPPSKAKAWALFVALCVYSCVGWCVLAIVKAIIGDPVNNYLASTHNNAVLAVSTPRTLPPFPSLCAAAAA